MNDLIHLFGVTYQISQHSLTCLTVQYFRKLDVLIICYVIYVKYLKIQNYYKYIIVFNIEQIFTLPLSNI